MYMAFVHENSHSHTYSAYAVYRLNTFLCYLNLQPQLHVATSNLETSVSNCGLFDHEIGTPLENGNLIKIRHRTHADIEQGVTIHWTGPLDWTTGLDYWTHL